MFEKNSAGKTNTFKANTDITDSTDNFLKLALLQGNNIRENPYNPCSKKEDESNKKINYVTII